MSKVWISDRPQYQQAPGSQGEAATPGAVSIPKSVAGAPSFRLTVGMPIQAAPDNDIDVSILLSTPDLEDDPSRITDEMREIMEKLLDPEFETWELSFVERKYAIQWGWV